MNTKMTAFDYDYDQDSLFIYAPNLKSKFSVEIGDIIIDYTTKKEISAIELLHASIIFKEMSSQNEFMTKETLKEISDCVIEVISRNNFYMLHFMCTLNSKKRIFAPILIPTLREKSPAII